MRRTMLSLVLALMLSWIGFVPAGLAQEATPAAGLDDLGLPELHVTATASGYEGIPGQIEAGRYLVTVTTDVEEGAGVAFLQPSGMTAAEFLAAAFPDSADGGASPVAGDTGEDEGAAPAFVYDDTFAGGAEAMPDMPGQVVLDLWPGEWIAWGDTTEAPQTPYVFEVTGEMPADLAVPTSVATISLGEYVIKVTEGALISGPQVIRIDNIGAQPHFVFAGFTTLPITDEDVTKVLDAEMTGTPAAVDFDPNTELAPVFSTATQSKGTSTWMTVDLAPGTYVLLCFFPDMADGIPHSYHGMHTVITVS